MRLLNNETLKLESFFDDQIPPYVILSHTWGEDEVTFDDIEKPYAKYMPGFKKMEKCCEQAKDDGYGYCWVDTCCIDKRSSAELSEATNSMYQWYWNAKICYAYLDGYRKGSMKGFCKHCWFTRGWTLQKLLAPEIVEFYDDDWNLVGTKLELRETINITTGIDTNVLKYRKDIFKKSIAEIFSWASGRQTTRKEDTAYSLLGLFDVNMPLLYEEGDEAFFRL